MKASPPTKRKPQHAYLRVEPDGALRCADEFTRQRIRKFKLKAGSRVRVTFSKERDYKQWKRAHQLGTLIAENLDDFAGLDSHDALKKLQRVSGVECEQSEFEVPGFGKLLLNLPRSLSYDEMDETRFQSAYSGFCRYLVDHYWQTLDEAGIESMASLVGMGST